ncbi:hypothetical protein [Streptomyces lavendulae]|uniref:hypothetical protein n=1 Tax=Streptomyces lavendulae TaxID=1914 RepID=UPI0031E8DB63
MEIKVEALTEHTTDGKGKSKVTKYAVMLVPPSITIVRGMAKIDKLTEWGARRPGGGRARLPHQGHPARGAAQRHGVGDERWQSALFGDVRPVAEQGVRGDAGRGGRGTTPRKGTGVAERGGTQRAGTARRGDEQRPDRTRTVPVRIGVKTHVSRLLHKLELDNRTRAAVMGHELGLAAR